MAQQPNRPGAEPGRLSFGTVSADYERGRPSYPAESVQWVLDGVSGLVADIGAGTGKLTAVIAGLGHRVVAIDPDPAMLSRLPTGIPTLPGSGEQIPLDDGALDGVTFGQAWHWVDPVAGSAEVARVLRPGGVLGLIWNIRDESVDWVRRLTEIIHGGAEQQMVSSGGPRVAPPLQPAGHHQHRWTASMTPEALESMIVSRSYLITAEPAVRDGIVGSARQLVHDHPDTAGADVIELPYGTHSYRFRRT
jgi:SAM-dependent methyltransferase